MTVKRKQRRKKGSARRRRGARAGRAAPRILRYAANAGAVVLTGFLALAALAAFFARDLPDTSGLWASERAPRVTLLTIDGAPMSVHGESHGAPVRLSELPAYVPDAVLAVEDRNFRHHIGVNPISVLRALIVNARAGDVRQGGSTITQQLAKNLFLSSDRTMKRKVQELLLALWLEHRFSKNEILTLYLNRVYFGAGAYGVDAASHRYYGKPAREMKLGEAAILAGLLKAPSRYAPTNNPQDAGQRARLVLDAMVEGDFISAADADRALGSTVKLASPEFSAAPYFTDHVLQEVQALAGGVDADLVVQTTFDPTLQRALEQGLEAGVTLTALDDATQVAAAIVDAEGGVRAMIGGRNYAKSQFNRAALARRQPGSAFKPFVYLAALEAGLAPEDHVLDAPVTVDRWTPDNYGGRFMGEVSLTDALAYSLNSAAVRIQEWTGRSAVRLTARRMGLETHTRGPALALGVDGVSPLELAGAYAPLANGGFRVRVHTIDSIKTIDGQLLYQRESAMGETAASYRSIMALNRMLGAVTAYGTGKAAAIEGRATYGKTGTTQDNRDAWFAGHAGGLVGVVWLGHDDNSAMAKSVTGGAAPAVIWREAMRRALANSPRQRPPMIAPLTPAPADDLDPLAALIREEA